MIITVFLAGFSILKEKQKGGSLGRKEDQNV